MTLKCAHCGIVFEYQRRADYDTRGVIAVLVACPNGHIAIVSEDPYLAGSRQRAKTMTEGEK